MNGLDINRHATAPLKFPRTRRNRIVQNMTSFTIGKMVPLAYVPLLREDAIKSGKVRINFNLQETAEILVNPLRVRVRAYLVSHLCDPRFEGSLNQLDRSYMGQPQIEGGDVVPFIETHAYGTAGSKAVYKTLGLHAASAKQVNMWPLKAYNILWNFLAKNRSPDLTPRSISDTSLAPAFWHHSKFAHIKPDFDAAVAEGEVLLNVTEGIMPVQRYAAGIAVDQIAPVKGNNGNIKLKYSGGPDETMTMKTGNTLGHTGAAVGVTQDVQFSTAVAALQADLAGFYADLEAAGLTVSIANIDKAREMQHYAKIVEHFDGHEDWIIDMLMNGLHIPDLAMTQPILLADKSTVFAQSLRFATDYANIDESATTGATFVDLNIRLPKGQRIGSGGVVLIVAEVLPEQLWERQRDVYFHSTDVAEWPEALRDTLDPQKVEEVFNSQIDTAHATPNAVFGYGPLNWEWDMRMAQLGGRFYAPAADGTFDEDRQRFYAVETVNPTLGPSFYICEDIHQNPFLNGGTPGALVDVVDATSLGGFVIEGNTQFGPALVEANGNWDRIEAVVPQERIESA